MTYAHVGRSESALERRDGEKGRTGGTHVDDGHENGVDASGDAADDVTHSDGSLCFGCF